MKPELHVCSKCKKEPVWTDCIPAHCYRCHLRSAAQHLLAALPDCAMQHTFDKITEIYQAHTAKEKTP